MSGDLEFLVGVDEAGRGPLAGPVATGAVVAPVGFVFPEGVKDSKRLSEKRREEWFAWMQSEPELSFSVTFVGARLVDRWGITRAISHGVRESLRKLDLCHEQCEVRLDGLLRAPKQFKRQETITRGDSLEPVIAAASIVAKVTRDRKMKRLAKRFPEYGFETHKGYGTRGHREIIDRIGFCDIHRQSFVATPTPDSRGSLWPRKVV